MSIGCGEQLEQSVCYNLQPCVGGDWKGTYGGLAFLPEGVAKLLDVIYDTQQNQMV